MPSLYWKYWLLAVSVAISILTSHSSHAAEFVVYPSAEDRPAVVVVQGEFLSGDDEHFVRRVVSLKDAIVVFSSPGGDLSTGLEIGKAIRLKNFATVVPEDTLCSSACALAWLGGTQRVMAKTAKIGFHAAYRKNSGFAQESGMANALVGAYLGSLGLPNNAVAYMTSASPASMNWLTIADAQGLGLNVIVYDPNQKDAIPRSDDTTKQDFQKTPPAQATDKIASVQSCLKGFRFYLGPVNGLLDEETSYSISKFQGAWGMRVTGAPTYELLSKCGLPVE